PVHAPVRVGAADVLALVVAHALAALEPKRARRVAGLDRHAVVVRVALVAAGALELAGQAARVAAALVALGAVRAGRVLVDDAVAVVVAAVARLVDRADRAFARDAAVPAHRLAGDARQ